jgi:hypothetical protein
VNYQAERRVLAMSFVFGIEPAFEPCVESIGRRRIEIVVDADSVPLEFLDRKLRPAECAGNRIELEDPIGHEFGDFWGLKVCDEIDAVQPSEQDARFTQQKLYLRGAGLVGVPLLVGKGPELIEIVVA